MNFSHSIPGRRQLVALVCATSVVLGVAACGSSANSDSSGKVTVTWWQPDVREEWVGATEGVIERFEDQHPDINVEMETVPWEDLAKKTQLARQSDTLPDLLYSFSGLHAGWAYSDMLAPVDDVIETIGEDSLPEAALTGSRIDGEYYTVPFATYPHVLWYRSDWFKEAGLSAPTTWEEVLTAAEKLADDQREGFALYNKAPEPHILISLMGANGAYTFDEEGNVAIDSPETVESLQMLEDMSEFAPSGALANSQTDARLQFAEGCCAMFLSSTSFANELVLDPSLQDKFAAVPFPTNHGDRGAVMDFASLSVPASSEHPEEAKRFIEFWFKDDVMLEFAEQTVVGHIPTLEAVTDSEEYWASERIKPLAPVLKNALEASAVGVQAGGTFGPHPCTTQVNAQNIWVEMGERVVIGDEAPDEVAAWAQDAITSICDG